MKKVIVTTTINPPTIAIKKFDAMKDWTLVVVGDKKTPTPYKINGIYLSPEDQEKMDKDLSDLIGWNCIQRRNFGFLYAFEKLDADVVATIDDDNIPLDGWGKDTFIPKKVNFYEIKSEVFDPMQVTEHKIYWHRGFPFQLFWDRYTDKIIKKKAFPIYEIQADFWQGDPDVDAYCRMLYQVEDIYFMKHKKFPFTSNKISPFNSQNTFLLSCVIPYYFMFPYVGRMDDIWASYYVQAKGFNVIYEYASVIQERNKHDLIEDMKNEYLGYEKNLDLIRSLKENSENIKNFLPEKSWQAFVQYRRHFE